MKRKSIIAVILSTVMTVTGCFSPLTLSAGEIRESEAAENPEGDIADSREEVAFASGGEEDVDRDYVDKKTIVFNDSETIRGKYDLYTSREEVEDGKYTYSGKISGQAELSEGDTVYVVIHEDAPTGRYYATLEDNEGFRYDCEYDGTLMSGSASIYSNTPESDRVFSFTIDSDIYTEKTVFIGCAFKSITVIDGSEGKVGVFNNTSEQEAFDGKFIDGSLIVKKVTDLSDSELYLIKNGAGTVLGRITNNTERVYIDSYSFGNEDKIIIEQGQKESISIINKVPDHAKLYYDISSEYDPETGDYTYSGVGEVGNSISEDVRSLYLVLNSQAPYGLYMVNDITFYYTGVSNHESIYIDEMAVDGGITVDYSEFTKKNVTVKNDSSHFGLYLDYAPQDEEAVKIGGEWWHPYEGYSYGQGIFVVCDGEGSDEWYGVTADDDHRTRYFRENEYSYFCYGDDLGSITIEKYPGPAVYLKTQDDDVKLYYDEELENEIKSGDTVEYGSDVYIGYKGERDLVYEAVLYDSDPDEGDYSYSFGEYVQKGEPLSFTMDTFGSKTVKISDKPIREYYLGKLDYQLGEFADYIYLFDDEGEDGNEYASGDMIGRGNVLCAGIKKPYEDDTKGICVTARFCYEDGTEEEMDCYSWADNYGYFYDSGFYPVEDDDENPFVKPITNIIISAKAVPMPVIRLSESLAASGLKVYNGDAEDVLKDGDPATFSWLRFVNDTDNDIYYSRQITGEGADESVFGRIPAGGTITEYFNGVCSEIKFDVIKTPVIHISKELANSGIKMYSGYGDNERELSDGDVLTDRYINIRNNTVRDCNIVYYEGDDEQLKERIKSSYYDRTSIYHNYRDLYLDIEYAHKVSIDTSDDMEGLDYQVYYNGTDGEVINVTDGSYVPSGSKLKVWVKGLKEGQRAAVYRRVHDTDYSDWWDIRHEHNYAYGYGNSYEYGKREYKYAVDRWILTKDNDAMMVRADSDMVLHIAPIYPCSLNIDLSAAGGKETGLRFIKNNRECSKDTEIFEGEKIYITYNRPEGDSSKYILEWTEYDLDGEKSEHSLIAERSGGLGYAWCRYGDVSIKLKKTDLHTLTLAGIPEGINIYVTSHYASEDDDRGWIYFTGDSMDFYEGERVIFSFWDRSLKSWDPAVALRAINEEGKTAGYGYVCPVRYLSEEGEDVHNSELEVVMPSANTTLTLESMPVYKVERDDLFISKVKIVEESGEAFDCLNYDGMEYFDADILKEYSSITNLAPAGMKIRLFGTGASYAEGREIKVVSKDDGEVIASKTFTGDDRTLEFVMPQEAVKVEAAPEKKSEDNSSTGNNNSSSSRDDSSSSTKDSSSSDSAKEDSTSGSTREDSTSDSTKEGSSSDSAKEGSSSDSAKDGSSSDSAKNDSSSSESTKESSSSESTKESSGSKSTKESSSSESTKESSGSDSKKDGSSSSAADSADTASVNMVPLTKDAVVASSKDNFAAEAPEKKINKMVLNFENVGKNSVSADELAITVVKGTKLTTPERVTTVECDNPKGIKAKINKKTGLLTLTPKVSGKVTIVTEAGKTYKLAITVDAPKAQKAVKNQQINEKAQIKLTLKDLFNTTVDRGELTAASKANQATVSDNNLIITPKQKDTIKVTYVFVNKKFKTTIKVK